MFTACGDIFLTRIPVANSPEECQVACAASDECKLWTYRHDSNKCFLKLGNVKVITNRSKATSGPKICGKFN